MSFDSFLTCTISFGILLRTLPSSFIFFFFFNFFTTLIIASLYLLYIFILITMCLCVVLFESIVFCTLLASWTSEVASLRRVGKFSIIILRLLLLSLSLFLSLYEWVRIAQKTGLGYYIFRVCLKHGASGEMDQLNALWEKYIGNNGPQINIWFLWFQSADFWKTCINKPANK